MEENKTNELENKLPQGEDKAAFNEETTSNKSEKPVQDAETNAYYASKRREKEAKKSYEDGIKDAIKVNPYTNEALKDDYDVKVYQTMKKLEEEGKDPLKALSSVLAESYRSKEQEIENKKKINEDIAKFNTEFPNVNLETLLQSDERFIAYADGKLGKQPINEIYKKYLKLFGVKEEKKETTNMPSSTSKGNLTQKSVRDMTEEEVHSLYEKTFRKNL